LPLETVNKNSKSKFDKAKNCSTYQKNIVPHLVTSRRGDSTSSQGYECDATSIPTFSPSIIIPLVDTRRAMEELRDFRIRIGRMLFPFVFTVSTEEPVGVGQIKLITCVFFAQQKHIF
jgi:hypothetical protein